MFDSKLLLLLCILGIVFVIVIAMSAFSEDDSEEWEFTSACFFPEKVESNSSREIRNLVVNSYDSSSRTYCLSYEFRVIDNNSSNHDDSYIDGTHKDYDCEFLENKKICTLKKQQTLWFFAYAQSDCNNVNDEQRLHNLAMGLTSCGDKIEYVDSDEFSSQKMDFIISIIVGFFLIAFIILVLFVVRRRSKNGDLQSDIAGRCGNCRMQISFTADYCARCGHKLLKKSTRHTISKLWYLLPVFLGFIGGMIMYYKLLNRNKRMGTCGLVVGCIITLSFLFLPWLLQWLLVGL